MTIITCSHFPDVSLFWFLFHKVDEKVIRYDRIPYTAQDTKGDRNKNTNDGIKNKTVYQRKAERTVLPK